MVLCLGKEILMPFGIEITARGGHDALIQQLLVRQLAVGGAGRVDDQALHVGHVGQQGEEPEAVDESEGFFLTTLYFNGEDGGSAVRKIALVEFVVRMLRQRWVVYFSHFRVL